MSEIHFFLIKLQIWLGLVNIPHKLMATFSKMLLFLFLPLVHRSNTQRDLNILEREPGYPNRVLYSEMLAWLLSPSHEYSFLKLVILEKCQALVLFINYCVYNVSPFFCIQSVLNHSVTKHFPRKMN